MYLAVAFSALSAQQEGMKSSIHGRKNIDFAKYFCFYQKRYYRLSAYMFPFLKDPKTAHQYKPGVTFNQILRLYRFDKKLRVLLFNEIEKIEVAFRSCVVDTMVNRTGDNFWMTNSAIVHPATISRIHQEYDRSSEDFIKHFKLTYSDSYPPA